MKWNEKYSITVYVQLHSVNAPYLSQYKLELYNFVTFNNLKIGMNKMLDWAYEY